MKKLLYLASVIALSLMSLPVRMQTVHADEIIQNESEEEDLTGIMYVKCNYSSDITPSIDDTFTIFYVANGHTEEKEITVNAYDACKEAIEETVEYGRYCVTDIVYEGSNQKISEDVFGSDLFFDIIADEEADTLNIAIGEEAGSELEANGNGVIVRNGESILTSFDKNAEEYNFTDEVPEDEDDSESDTIEESSRPSESNQKGDIVYYGHEEEKTENRPLIYRVIPLFIIAIGVFATIFVMHKKGKF